MSSSFLYLYLSLVFPLRSFRSHPSSLFHFHFPVSTIPFAFPFSFLLFCCSISVITSSNALPSSVSIPPNGSSFGPASLPFQSFSPSLSFHQSCLPLLKTILLVPSSLPHLLPSSYAFLSSKDDLKEKRIFWERNFLNTWQSGVVVWILLLLFFFFYCFLVFVVRPKMTI